LTIGIGYFVFDEFSTDGGQIMFGYDLQKSATLKLHSPDNTSDGWLKRNGLFQMASVI
jgi:hypothetical protein